MKAKNIFLLFILGLIPLMCFGENPPPSNVVSSTGGSVTTGRDNAGGGGTISTTNPGGGITIDNPNPNPSGFQYNNNRYQRLDRRIEILEHSRDDLNSWVMIFVTSVTILIALNIGISVWQIGSIARKEVSQHIDGLQEEINALLEQNEKGFETKISEFQNNLSSIISKIESLEKKSGDYVEESDNRIKALQNELTAMIDKFRKEAGEIKSMAQTELETWYSKKMG